MESNNILLLSNDTLIHNSIKKILDKENIYVHRIGAQNLMFTIYRLDGKILMLSIYKLLPPPDLSANLNLKFSTQKELIMLLIYTCFHSDG